MPAVQIPVIVPLTGEFDAHIHDPSGTPINVIPTQTAWSVHGLWHMDGPIAPLLDGTWELRVSLESIGGGVEFTSAPVVVDYQTGATPGPNTMSYSAFVNFPAGTPALGAADSVPYHVVAHLFFKEPSGKPGPFAAAVDLGIVQVYDDQP